jgi:hypothetical protein
MTPKEKAKELVDKYFIELNEHNESYDEEAAIQCALIAVDEIRYFMINSLKWDKKHNGNVLYWNEVKQEIINL